MTVLLYGHNSHRLECRSGADRGCDLLTLYIFVLAV